MVQEVAQSIAQETREGPLLRVFLFGPFALEWQVFTTGDQSAWNRRTSAHSLFKLLLYAPDQSLDSPTTLVANHPPSW